MKEWPFWFWLVLAAMTGLLILVLSGGIHPSH